MKSKLSTLLLLATMVSCHGNFKGTMDETNQSLGSLSGQMTPQVIGYEKNKVANVYPFAESKVAVSPDTEWNLQVKRTPVAGDPCAADYELVFKLQKGEMPSAGAAIELSFDNWDTQNYLFAPAAMYDGNRFRILNIDYPPYIYNPADRPLDMPVTVAGVPHMNQDGTDGRIEMLTSNCATPLVGFFDKAAQRGFFLQTTQDTLLGNAAFDVREYPAQHKLAIRMTTPGVREKQYVMCYAEQADQVIDAHDATQVCRPRLINSTDKAIDLAQGDQISMKFRLYNFEAADLNAYFDKFLTIRKALSGQNEWLNRDPFSHIAQTILDHHDKTKWYEDDKCGYICDGPEGEIPFWHLQLGWNGVPVYSLSHQLRQPTPERMRRLFKTFDTIEKMQGKSGLFYGMLRRGELLGDSFADMANTREVSLIRRTGLAIYSALQIFDLMKMRGQADMIKPSWEAMMKRATDALVKLWETYGQFGQHVNAETGEITTNNSSAGVINIAALAYASRYFNEGKYMEVAQAAADYYYQRDLCKGYMGGAPAEILQAPDSEASAEFAESLMALFEMTRNVKWLDMAKAAVAYLSTWVVSYDFQFPDYSVLHKINAKATGSVWASIQNEHSAPGLYIMSGDFMLKLYRATGDERYLQLGRDIAHNVVQYVMTPDNVIIEGADAGSVSERVNLSDWEGKEEVGGNIAGDPSNIAWENVTLFSILQNPGVYVLTDTKELFVYDHVVASLAKAEDGKLQLTIENPNKYDADVTIFAETTADARANSLGWTAYTQWPIVHVPAGQAVTYDIP